MREDAKLTIPLDVPGPGDAREIAELLDLAPVGALVRTLDSDVITYWSHGSEQLYGWTRAEALGQVSHSLLQTVFPTSQVRHGAFTENNGPVVW